MGRKTEADGDEINELIQLVRGPTKMQVSTPLSTACVSQASTITLFRWNNYFSRPLLEDWLDNNLVLTH